MMGRNRNSIKRPLLINLFLIFTLIVMYFVDMQLGPIIYKAAVADSKMALSNIINEAFLYAMDQNKMSYSDIVKLTYDSDGDVKSITTDAIALNKFKSDFLSYYLKKVNRTLKFSINAGVLSGYTFLNNLGPKVNFYTDLSQQPDVDYSTSFESAGINQTLHRIVMHVNIDISFLFYSGVVSDAIESEYVFAESVIVGDIPQSYTNISITGARK